MSSIFPFLSSVGSNLPDVGSLLCGRAHIPLISVSKILPYTMDGPFKQSINFFMRLAWSNKVQLPVLIAVCFMAFDIRLQLEINIFWEANHRQNIDNNHHHQQQQQRRGLLNGSEPSPAIVERDDSDLDEDLDSSDFGLDSDDDDDDSGGELVSEILIVT